MGGARAYPQSAAVGSRFGLDFDAAADSLELPAHVEARDSLIRAVGNGSFARENAVEAVEGDLGLTLALVRRAVERDPRTSTVPRAVDALAPAEVEAVARACGVFDPFEEDKSSHATGAAVRFHAAAVKRVVERLVAETDGQDRDELVVAALLHDVGKLVLSKVSRSYSQRVGAPAGTPEQRLRRERRTLGVDHAVVGGELARRWGLPEGLAEIIERHHTAERGGPAAVLRVADLLANYGHGRRIDLRKLATLAGRLGLSSATLGRLMYELPFPAAARAHVEPCPLSSRELEVVQCLAEGKVYKQIAGELDISTATVRTHLHRTYGKLGAVDRAQAVLIATRRGWLDRAA